MHPQGTNSPTFSAGPVDGALTIPQLLELQLKQSPDHPAYIYDDPQGEIISINFSQYIRTVHAAARLFLRDTDTFASRPDDEATVIAIFATADTISYCMMVAAVMRAGMVPFCVSPRNSPASLGNLLKQTSSAAVYVSDDLRGVLSEGLAIHGSPLPVFNAPTFIGFQCDLEASSEPVLPPIGTAAMSSTALIIHSSGSTSVFSRPVYLSHRLLLQYATAPWTSDKDHYGQVFGSHILPNFHGIGVFLQTWPFTSGLVVAVHRPTTPPILPNPETALKAMMTIKPDLVMATPAYIETWSEDPNGLKTMQSLKYLSYVGATLNKRVGDDLVAKGVVLCSTYGAMEVGLVAPFFKSHGKDWDYISVLKERNAVRVVEDDGSGLYTHTYLVSPTFATAYTNTQIDGKPGCSVSDLLEQHPENPDLHRVYGRKDDLIAFSTAAKMNPVPVEAQVNRNPFVDAVLVFGQGKPHPGMIIQLKLQFQDDLQHDEKRSKISDSLWVSVDEANKTSPTHFQIPRKAVILADPKKPFALTSKFQPRRRVVFEQYQEEIHAVYRSEGNYVGC